MKKENIVRGIFYAIGLLVLACGLTLNTKAGLGVSPIISTAYFASYYTNISFGDTTLVVYSILVVIEIVLHTLQKKNKIVYLLDVLQIALSLVFTRFLNIFGVLFPDCGDKSMTIRILVLLLAIICTGIGAAMSLDMRLIPNPGDGIVQAIADQIHKDIGFTKNCVDFTCLALTLVISLLLTGKIIGIGIGTVLAMLGVGRVIAIFNHFALKPMQKIAFKDE